MYWVLLYDYVDDYVEKRAPVREEHLGLARAALERDEFRMGGAWDDSPAGGMLIFKGDDASVAETFARNDPYVREGVVIGWRVRPWNVAVGG